MSSSSADPPPAASKALEPAPPLSLDALLESFDNPPSLLYGPEADPSTPAWWRKYQLEQKQKQEKAAAAGEVVERVDKSGPAAHEGGSASRDEAGGPGSNAEVAEGRNEVDLGGDSEGSKNVDSTAIVSDGGQ